LFTGPAVAQKWVVYTPPERDFRVLFPSEPTQGPTRDGAVAFRSQQESGDGHIEYVVYRLPASVKRTGNEAQDIEALLKARLGDDVPVRPIREEDTAADYQRYAFEYRRSVSVHRLAGAPGRYYHLEVMMPHGRSVIALQTARDFFASFQAGGVSVPGILAGFTQKVESWCQGRTDSFTRMFCEYSVCLQPGFETNPRCTGLFKR
jgi:hypothetical protein